MRNLETFRGMRRKLTDSERREISEVQQRRLAFADRAGRSFEKPHIVRKGNGWVCAKKEDLRILVETQGQTYRPFGSGDRPDLALHSWALNWLLNRPLRRITY